ncbi:MAG: hypothetical protein HYZ72_02475 [Deltaproteobacteria bacterium]|nr:hypothetical protein [Deltaproteobacteria bacterium]
MTLREYASRILASNHDDWTVNSCWGFGSGPSYLDQIAVWTTGTGKFSNIEVHSHSVVASLKTDLSISLAWGFPHNPEFKEPWANKFPDSSASSAFVDFFYNGVLVFRDIYVSVDGGRCMIPLPDREFDKETHQVRRLIVPRGKYSFFRLLDSFEKVSDFNSYFEGTGIEIVDTPWMV